MLYRRSYKLKGLGPSSTVNTATPEKFGAPDESNRLTIVERMDLGCCLEKYFHRLERQ